MNKLKDAEETGSPQWRTFGYLGICRDMQNPVTYSDGFYSASDRDLAIRAVNSYATHRALIAELVEALEGVRQDAEAAVKDQASEIQHGDTRGMEPIQRWLNVLFALTRAKEALK